MSLRAQIEFSIFNAVAQKLDRLSATLDCIISQISDWICDESTALVGRRFLAIDVVGHRGIFGIFGDFGDFGQRIIANTDDLQPRL